MQPLSKVKLFQFVIFAITFFTFFSAAAKPPPVGTPKKNVCSKNLIIAKVVDLEFGDFTSSNAGTVTVSPAGSRNASATITLLGGTVNAAAFDVTNTLAGCDYWPVRIQIQGVPTSLAGPGTAMVSDTYISSPTGTFTLSATPGTPTRVNVGATLATNTPQTGGFYTTAAPFALRVSHINKK